MVEGTSKSVNLLLFADDTTSLCRRSNMQHRKELLKQTFGDWKLILNDDKWEHIIAESDPEERKRQRKKWKERHECSLHTGTPWVRFITIKNTVS